MEKRGMGRGEYHFAIDDDGGSVFPIVETAYIRQSELHHSLWTIVTKHILVSRCVFTGRGFVFAVDVRPGNGQRTEINTDDCSGIRRAYQDAVAIGRMGGVQPSKHIFNQRRACLGKRDDAITLS